MKIPLLRPLLPNADAIMPYLRAIDENRWYTNFGPLVTQLEGRLKEMLSKNGGGAPQYLTTVSNCTVGLELAITALGLRPGSTILVPGLTFVATATAVLRGGNQLLLGDIDPSTWLLTPKIARDALKTHPYDVVMPVATFGCPQKVDDWDRFSEETGIPVIIDAAGAFGNQAPARLATVVFSSHATKTLSSAEGGIVVSANEQTVKAVRQMSNFGIDLSALSSVRPGLVNLIGTNAKMSEYHAAIALAALDQWEQTSQQRLALARDYETRLDAIAALVTRQKTEKRLVNSLMPIRLNIKYDLINVITRLKERGIETRRWYCPPLQHHPAFSEAKKADELPETESLTNALLGLPFYLDMTPNEVAYVCDTLTEILTLNDRS